jgi:hypothetical protein
MISAPRMSELYWEPTRGGRYVVNAVIGFAVADFCAQNTGKSGS